MSFGSVGTRQRRVLDAISGDKFTNNTGKKQISLSQATLRNSIEGLNLVFQYSIFVLSSLQVIFFHIKTFTMLISFQKSSHPHLLINTDHIISMYCQVKCHHLRPEVEVPPFVSIIEDISFYRCVDKAGEDAYVCKGGRTFYDKNHNEVFICDPLKSKFNNIDECFTAYAERGKDSREYRIVEDNVAYCKLELDFSATGNAEHGSSTYCVLFRFFGLENFLAAINAIKESTGIFIVE